jgi:hypothetical protein
MTVHAPACGSARGSVCQCERQCAAVQAAVHSSAAVCDNVRGSVQRQCKRQCAAVRQCVTMCAAVCNGSVQRQCAAVVVRQRGSWCGSAGSSVRQCSNVARCGSVQLRMAVCGSAAVRQRVWQCGSVRQQCVLVRAAVCVCLSFNKYIRLNLMCVRFECVELIKFYL